MLTEERGFPSFSSRSCLESILRSPSRLSVGERHYVPRRRGDQRAAGGRQRAIFWPALQHWHDGTRGSWPLYPPAHEVARTLTLTFDLCGDFSPLLTRLSRSLLEDRVTRLHGQLQRTQQQLMASSDPGSVDRKVLDDLYEDIHWLILVSGLSLDPPLCSPFCFSSSGLGLYVLNWIFNILLLN